MPFTDVRDPAIPSDIINLLHNQTFTEGLGLSEDVKCIRISLVPEGYEPYPFRNGVEECMEDILKTIVVLLEYYWQVCVRGCRLLNLSLHS